MIGDGGQEEGWVVCRIFKKKNHLKTLESPLASSITEETIMRNNHDHHESMFDVDDDEGSLEQILEQMGRSCKEEEQQQHQNDTIMNKNDNNHNIINNNGYFHHDKFLKLPRLESPKSNNTYGYHPILEGTYSGSGSSSGFVHHQSESTTSHLNNGLITSWAALDRLVASQLNGSGAGQTETSRGPLCFNAGEPYGLLSEHDLQIPTLRSSSLSSIISSSSSAHNYDYTTSEIDLWNFARSASSLVSSSGSEPLCHVSNTSSV